MENEYVDRYRINGKFYETIVKILSENESEIISECQKYLKECEMGNKHIMTPNIDGIISVLESRKK